MRANPLGFSSLADKYLAMKQQTVKHGTLVSMRPLMERATAFGRHYLQDVWTKACQKLGIEGVSLYPGTRHSTCQFLSQHGRTPEQVKRLTDHTTNKASDRYLQIETEEKHQGVEFIRRKKKGVGNVVEIGKQKS